MEELVFKTFFVEADMREDYEKMLESKIEGFKRNGKASYEEIEEIARSAPAISCSMHSDDKMFRTCVVVGVTVTFRRIRYRI